MKIPDSQSILPAPPRGASAASTPSTSGLPADSVSLGHDTASTLFSPAQIRGGMAIARSAVAVPPAESAAARGSASLEAVRQVVAREVVEIVDLPAEPAPQLKRPVLFVHGFMGDATDFKGMIDWLGREGTNHWGGVIPGGQAWEADPKANYFALNFSKQWNPIERNVAELKAAIDEICRKTGATGVDIVAHSKGGLDVRSYLMNPDEKVDHLLLLGSPAHGALLADLGAFARDRMHLQVFPNTHDPDATRCLEELSADHPTLHGTSSNPVLHELNAHWDVQRSRAQTMEIAGAGIPTLGGLLGATPFGDGLVAERSAQLPGIPEKRLWFRQHALLPFSKAAMREMVAFFADQPSPTGPDLFDDGALPGGSTGPKA